MCGFFQGRSIIDMCLASVITCINDRITHRGSDDAVIWEDEAIGLGLRQRRLVILDLSPAGHQPIPSDCLCFAISFNCEIYNHLDLRSRLTAVGKASAWRGNSDTETLLACFVASGLENALQATLGMFAIALWDRQERLLTLASDRMGKTLLYFGWQGDVLLLGSELKAFKSYPAFRGAVDRNALTLLLVHNCILAPYSIYEGITKLMPGNYLDIPVHNTGAPRVAQPQVSWPLNEAVEQGQANPLSGSAYEEVGLLQKQPTPTAWPEPTVSSTG